MFCIPLNAQLDRHNCSRVVKPFCCLLLLSGSLPPRVFTVEVELEELVKKLQKGRLEGECTFRQKIIVVECFKNTSSS